MSRGAGRCCKSCCREALAWKSRQNPPSGSFTQAVDAMKRFQFSLESVATLRRHQEQRALEAFSQASAQHRTAGDQLARFLQEQDDLCRSRPFEVAQGAVVLLQQAAWHDVLAARIAEQVRLVQVRLQAALEAKHRWMLARQATEGLAKLKDQRIALHRESLLAEEQRALDELSGDESLARGLLRVQGDEIE